MTQYKIKYTNGNDPQFVKLCHELDAFLQERIGAEKQKSQYDQYNSLADIHDVILIVEDGNAVGCGAIKQYDFHTMEMKRMFVKASERHNGYGRILVESLEKLAKEKGIKKLVLETGKPLIEAPKLYSSCSFKLMDNYGQYQGITNSICMYKYL